jgi:hypothetical protein
MHVQERTTRHTLKFAFSNPQHIFASERKPSKAPQFHVFDLAGYFPRTFYLENNKKTTTMHRPATFNPPWVNYFESPCPYYVNRFMKFTLFPQLPAGVQLMIWSFAQKGGQYIKITSDDDINRRKVDTREIPPAEEELREWRCFYKYKVPPLLHTCYDSRKVALRTYRLAFAAQLGHPVYFDFEHDGLSLDSPMALTTFVHSTPKFGVSPKDADSVQRVSFEFPNTVRPEITSKWCRKLCTHFGRLRLMRLIDHEDRVRGDFISTDLLIGQFLEDDIFTPQDRDLITSPIPGRRGRLEDWVPPAVLIGTPTQWNNEKLYNFNGELKKPCPTLALPGFEFTPLDGRVNPLGDGLPPGKARGGDVVNNQVEVNGQGLQSDKD